MKQIKKLLKLFLALVLIGVGLYFLYRNKSLTLSNMSSSFSQEPVEIVKFELTDIPEEEKPKRILIPRLKIDLEVKESEVISGYWKVFEDTAGWGVGTSAPGYLGNQVIFAHAREGLFGKLDEIMLGDNIYVFNKSNWFLYKVSEIKEVYPGETEVIEQTKDERLTLYSCSGFRDEKRLVIIAARE